MNPPAHANTLLAEARRANERRVLVIAGEHDAAIATSNQILDRIDVGITDTVVLSERDDWHAERLEYSHSDRIMGRTCGAVVLDCHASTEPNAIARAAGAVDGGGLLLVLAPPLEDWPNRRDAFDEGLVVAPWSIDDVSGRFKRRFVERLSVHPGISVIDVDGWTLERSGITDPDPADPPTGGGRIPPDHAFPKAAYQRCLTADQCRVLGRFERLLEPNQAVIVSAPRGRGKSAVAGMAVTSLAASGMDVAVTAVTASHTQTLFEHATALANVLTDTSTVIDPDSHLELGSGSVRFRPPADVLASDPDVVVADEAAAIPVPVLTDLLSVDRIGCCTTLYGYEGSGHGFALRFREALTTDDHRVTDCEMVTPIRYAAGDPIESWVTDALLLDAHPAVDAAVADATPASVTVQPVEPAALATNDRRLRECIGLLAAAHYRTEPNDVARILDAPNLSIVTGEYAGHVVAVMLVAAEGGLDANTRADAYRGGRLHGNMLPDIFINEFRRPAPTARAGHRVVRIAVHNAVRRRGLGTQLLDHLRASVDDGWIGTGFGATPIVLAFWTDLGFVPILLGATRNPASGCYSVVLLDGDHDATRGLAREFGRTFPDRLAASLPDIHRQVDPEVVDTLLAAAPVAPGPDLDANAWRQIVAMGSGPGRYDLDPRPLKELLLAQLVTRSPSLDPATRRLAIGKVLQGRSWEGVAEPWPSTREARRTLGEAVAALVDEYGGPAAAAERRRLERP